MSYGACQSFSYWKDWTEIVIRYRITWTEIAIRYRITWTEIVIRYRITWTEISDPLPNNMDTYTVYEAIAIVRERHSDVDKKFSIG